MLIDARRGRRGQEPLSSEASVLRHVHSRLAMSSIEARASSTAFRIGPDEPTTRVTGFEAYTGLLSNPHFAMYFAILFQYLHRKVGVVFLKRARGF